MDKKWCKNVLMVNRDPNWYYAIDDTNAETCRTSLENYFSFYDGAVTDVCLGLLEQTTINPSDCFHWRGLKYLQKKENGIDVTWDEEDAGHEWCFWDSQIKKVLDWLPL